MAATAPPAAQAFARDWPASPRPVPMGMVSRAAIGGESPVRLLFDGTIFGLQRVGGISTYAAALLRRLAAMRDIELELRLPRTVISTLADSLTPLRASQAALPNWLTRYAGMAADGGAEIVHSPYYRRPRGSRTHAVVTVHDFVYERYRRGLPLAVHHWQKLAACRRADAIIAVSANTAADLADACPDIGAGRVRVIPLAVDHRVFAPVAAAARDPGLAGAVLFVGRRGGYKRFDLAVEAVALTDRLELAIVGAMPDCAERARLDRRLPGRWRWLGRLDDAALRRAYASAHACICPSDYEGFGLPILEAQACGCPVVAAARSSFPEVGGEAARYAASQRAEDYADAMAAADRDRHAVRAAGIANAARFSWDATAAQTRAVYRELAGR